MKFFKLNREAPNIVRCVKTPWQYMAHTDLIHTQGPYYGLKLKCAELRGQGCALCSHLKSPPRARWILPVISRLSNHLELIDVGMSIFKDFQNLARDPDWGNPDQYDVEITHQGEFEGWRVRPRVFKTLDYADRVIIAQEYNDYYLRALTEPATFAETESIIQHQDYRKIK